MKVAGILIGGRSVSGHDTAISLPEMGILLDCGHATHFARMCHTVLITHAHLDHLGGIIRHGYIRGMIGAEPSHFIVPVHLEPVVHEMFDFWARVQGSRKAPYKVTGVAPGEKFHLGNGRFVRPFKTHHTIPSQGYVIGEDRKALKPEFQGLPGPELGALRRKGVELETFREELLVAFTGDTRATVYDDDLEALKAKVLIMECTFVNDEVSESEARRKGHTHLSEIVARADRFKNQGLVLAHFSHRHNNAAVEAAISTIPVALREKVRYLPVNQ